MRICMGSDHAGLDLKLVVKAHLEAQGHEVTDVGTYTPESCDYPQYGAACARKVVAGEADYGILICGTGIGISMAASKVPGTRVALCTDTYMAKMTRMHNDANILAFGARVLGEGPALDIVDMFLNTAFEGGRHARRVNMIMDLEKDTEPSA